MKLTAGQLRRIIKEEIAHVVEDTGPQYMIAIALKNRAEEMVGYKQTVDPKFFMHRDGREGPGLANDIYRDYVTADGGGVSSGPILQVGSDGWPIVDTGESSKEKLHNIIGRIGVDYFDEDIEDALLRWTGKHRRQASVRWVELQRARDIPGWDRRHRDDSRRRHHQALQHILNRGTE